MLFRFFIEEYGLSKCVRSPVFLWGENRTKTDKVEIKRGYNKSDELHNYRIFERLSRGLKVYRIIHLITVKFECDIAVCDWIIPK